MVGLLANLYEFPSVDQPGSKGRPTDTSRRKAMRPLLPRKTTTQLCVDLGSYTHVFSHQKRTYYVEHQVITCDDPTAKMEEGRLWVTEDEVKQRSVSVVTKRIWELYLDARDKKRDA
jgi:adenine-specific DNA glycosylase